MLIVIKTALAEVGYLEKATNSKLDSPTANAGRNNYTKYARDMDAIGDFYNGRKQGYAWCDVFVDWCFVQAYGVEKARQLLCQPEKSLGAGCTYSAEYYKKAGRFYTENPKPGDQAFFLTGGSIGHTGLVYAVDDKNVYTIEGNTNGASGVISNGGGVCKKFYDLNDRRIAGYGRPDYKLVDDDEGGMTIYVVKKGDTLSRIAAKYNTTYKELAEFNGIKNPNFLAIGQSIRIPAAPAEEITETQPTTQPEPEPTTQVVVNIDPIETPGDAPPEVVTVEVPATDDRNELAGIYDKLTAIEEAVATAKSEIAAMMKGEAK